MRFDLITAHPELVRSPLDHSIVRRARDAGAIEVHVHDLRNWAEGRHRQIDDTPYGGGAGMVLRVDVLARAIRAISSPESLVVLLDPAGERFDQARARGLSAHPHLVLVCGHYEGVDARVRELVDAEISIGDYVLTGGEVAALVVLEATARLVPGVLGNAHSAQDESFSKPLLEYPQYTRPRDFEGQQVPEVLLSGHHARIEAWRREHAVALTRARRPDLVDDDEAG